MAAQQLDELAVHRLYLAELPDAVQGLVASEHSLDPLTQRPRVAERECRRRQLAADAQSLGERMRRLSRCTTRQPEHGKQFAGRAVTAAEAPLEFARWLPGGRRPARAVARRTDSTVLQALKPQVVPHRGD